MRQGATIDEHDEWLFSCWNNRVRPKDRIYVLGDICFDISKMPLFNTLNGEKILIRGNHDKFDTMVYMKYFKEIHGITKYKEFWLSHCPIHPIELRGKKNIHGHVHHNHIPDNMYINVCVEAVNGVPISLEEIRSKA
jgi:calcineurin-like phosphoesterase family protein